MVGDGTITLENAYAINNIIHINDETIELEHNNTIELTGGDDSIENYLSNVTINASAGNDSISNEEDAGVKIDAGAGNDTVLNGITKNCTIIGGDGDDSIHDYFYGDSIKIDAGAGNDTVTNECDNVTIDGGAGNDSLWGSTEADTFVYDAGKDVIFGFDDKDTLTLDNLDFKTSYSKGTITFKVDGDSITLKDFTATTFHVNNDVYKITNGKFGKN